VSGPEGVTNSQVLAPILPEARTVKLAAPLTLTVNDLYTRVVLPAGAENDGDAGEVVKPAIAAGRTTGAEVRIGPTVSAAIAKTNCKCFI
jgi:hypothetical protein